MPADQIRIPPDELNKTFKSVLKKIGFNDNPASICAEVFTTNSIDGVYSHGVNRFPRFVGYVKDGLVNPNATPTCKHQAGAIEQWDGGMGLDL